MDFVFLWKSDLNFKFYISVYKDFVGREWMMEDIVYELLYIDCRGFLIVVELGFGKLVFILYIVCSYDKNLLVYLIYEKIVGIYMCRYDLNLIFSLGIFVCNMVGKLVESFFEFGNILNIENMVFEYLISLKCI